ncbi:MAG TPA: urease accessory UreF family protein, partial [Thermomicrobiales bacterium]|nr:urease accessory UreF family protein [Thermomicrobiales bacterium]
MENGTQRNGRSISTHGTHGGGLRTFLASLQLTDSFFPSGLFTLSHGIESYAQAGLLTPRSLAGIVADQIRAGVGPSDATALALAFHSAQQSDLHSVTIIDCRLTAVKIAREPRETSIRLGRQLLALARDVFACELARDYFSLVDEREAPGNHAVALALLKATLGIPLREAVAGELYSFAASCVGAAVRMSVIDHRNAQRMLLLLHPVIETTTDDALARPLMEMGGSVPFVELMSMRHEVAELRLFST